MGTEPEDASQFFRIFLFIAFGLAIVVAMFGLLSHSWWAIGFGVFVMIGTPLTYISGERRRKAASRPQP